MPDESAVDAIDLGSTSTSEQTAEGELLISGATDYVYSNYAEVTWSNTELRIAFGDAVPGKGVRPKAGVVLLLAYAEVLYERLEEVLAFIHARQGTAKAVSEKPR